MNEDEATAKAREIWYQANDEFSAEAAIEIIATALSEALIQAQADLSCGRHEGFKMVWCNECIREERNALSGERGAQ